MTADERLDQLEPLMAENMAILDRHTAQLKQLQNAVSQIGVAVSQQADSINFLLREQLVMKNDIAELKSDVAELKSGFTEMSAQQTTTNSKLDQILNLLQK